MTLRRHLQKKGEIKNPTVYRSKTHTLLELIKNFSHMSWKDKGTQSAIWSCSKDPERIHTPVLLAPLNGSL